MTIGDSMSEMTTQPQAPAKFEKKVLTAKLRKSVIISPDSKHLEFKVNELDQLYCGFCGEDR